MNFDKNHKKIKQKQEINKTVFSCLQFTIILKEEVWWVIAGLIAIILNKTYIKQCCNCLIYRVITIVFSVTTRLLG